MFSVSDKWKKKFICDTQPPLYISHLVDRDSLFFVVVGVVVVVVCVCVCVCVLVCVCECVCV